MANDRTPDQGEQQAQRGDLTRPEPTIRLGGQALYRDELGVVEFTGEITYCVTFENITYQQRTELLRLAKQVFGSLPQRLHAEMRERKEIGAGGSSYRFPPDVRRALA
jgi:hypothetical protein